MLVIVVLTSLFFVFHRVVSLSLRYLFLHRGPCTRYFEWLVNLFLNLFLNSRSTTLPFSSLLLLQHPQLLLQPPLHLILYSQCLLIHLYFSWPRNTLSNTNTNTNTPSILLRFSLFFLYLTARLKLADTFFPFAALLACFLVSLIEIAISLHLAAFLKMALLLLSQEFALIALLFELDARLFFCFASLLLLHLEAEVLLVGYLFLLLESWEGLLFRSNIGAGTVGRLGRWRLRDRCCGYRLYLISRISIPLNLRMLTNTCSCHTLHIFFLFLSLQLSRPLHLHHFFLLHLPVQLPSILFLLQLLLFK